ncbi:hypothetical protein DFH08DRAFT_749981 [Mycena albidolilacea]|uniref:FAD/NAD(P)-binding domain-containing protein n=1 Tax=Mycena albidolilacea TaxID=1033008 RepID=A0AAD7EKS7_9AGAR|nr:hypothetical protein DFH08DRAFT_749981 [Mycena albidolilacea]
MPQIVIVGAGIGGVGVAIALKRQLGFEDFVIYEKGQDIGGTWRDNIYPGASSDVGIHFYSLSTDLKPDWPSTHGSQEQIYDYWRKLATKYNIYSRAVLNRLVVSAEWSTTEELYHVVTEDVESGARFSTTAKILISAVGLLHVPRLPSIPGIFSFRGNLFHSARWDTGVDLAGKRVAVIGNGTSAVQFIPLISEDATVHITEFCRTPNWIVPPIRADFSPLWKWAFQHIPLAMRTYRLLLYLRSEMIYLTIFSSPRIRSRSSALLKRYIMATAPKETHGNLLPDYALGCKRIIINQNYLESLHRPNLALNWDGIQSIYEDGIVTKTGDKISFDVMIFATGFAADRYPLTVVGGAGKTVQEYYDSQGGPKAYLGATVPGFPNLFLLGGPNLGTGHTSAILTGELQMGYILKFVKPIVDGLVSSFEVTTEATDAYNDLIQRRLERSVFVECLSWYRTDGEGKVSSIFPGPMLLYGWWVRRPRWSDYIVKAKTAQWEQKMRREKWMAYLSPMHYLSFVLGCFISCIGA